MPRPTPHQQLDRIFRDEYGQSAQTTQKGLMSYQGGSLYDSQIREASRPEYMMRYEIPARNKVISYLIQEMMSICSHVYRAHDKLAGDCSMDSTGSGQPYMITVNESLPQQREKIQAAIRQIIKNTHLGVEGRMRYFRMIRTGDAIGQKICTRDRGGNWDITKVMLMPTWEMFYNPMTDVWTQKREGDLTGRPIATWKPGQIVRSSFNSDHNFPYGSPLSERIIVNYRQYVFAMEDLLVASRTQSPRLLAHMIGKKGATWTIDPQAIENYRSAHESRGRNLLTDLYLTQDWMEIKEIKGNPMAVKEQLNLLLFLRVAMLEDMGMPPPPQDMSGGRISESVDASYASYINQIRMQDNPFVLDVVKFGLLLRNFDDVDMDLIIPPLGETESVRWERALKALKAGGIGYPEYCGILGLKDWQAQQNWVEEYWQWRAKMAEQGTPVGDDGKMSSAGLPGTEAAGTGSDMKKADERRSEQRRAGKESPSGA